MIFQNKKFKNKQGNWNSLNSNDNTQYKNGEMIQMNKKLVWRSKHNDEVDREGVPVDEEGGDVEVVERAGRG